MTSPGPLGRTPGAVREALTAAGLELPPVAAPVAAYRPAVRAGGWVHTSGQVALRGGAPLVPGPVGPGATSVADAAGVAGVCALQVIAAALAEVGADEVVLPVKVTVFVAVAEGFTDIPEVANGASSVLEAAFGSAHARSAVGCRSLPRGVAVEVEGIFAVGAGG